MIEIKKKIVEKEYWDCGKGTHFHRSKHAAIDCIKRQNRVTQRASRHMTLVRNCDIFRRHVVNGEKIDTLSEEYGLTIQSMRQLIRGVMMRFVHYRDPGVGFYDFKKNKGLKYWKENKEMVQRILDIIIKKSEEDLA